MDSFKVSAFEVFDKGWALVTAGNPEHYNTMTISWGGLGTLWSKPVATVYVKPCRYTYEFMEQNELFTVSFYSEDWKKDLAILGTNSGRNCDKVSLTHLHPAEIAGTTTFREAAVTLVCRKLYFADIDAAKVPEDARQRYYAAEAPHRMYIGEVLQIVSGEEFNR